MGVVVEVGVGVEPISALRKGVVGGGALWGAEVACEMGGGAEAIVGAGVCVDGAFSAFGLPRTM